MRAATCVVAALCLVLTAPGIASADPPDGDQLRYAGELLSPSLVADSTPHGSHGAVLTGGGGNVISVADTAGDNYLRFPGGTCLVPPCAQAIVQPIGSATLIPDADGFGRFAFGADIRLTEEPSPAAGMNVFQFGAAGAGLSQWKLQVDYGRPSCRWSDGTTAVLLMGGEPRSRLPIGVWYRVRCARLSPVLFEIQILDRASGELFGPPVQQFAAVGPIRPTGTVAIGGKRIRDTQSDVDTDQFHGDLDEIFFWRQ